MLESEALGISVCHRLLFGSSTIALALLCILCERQTCQVPPMPNGLSTLPVLSSGESSPHTAIPHYLWLLSVQHVMWTQTLNKASKAEKPVSNAQLLSRESPDFGIRTTMKIRKHSQLEAASRGHCPHHRELLG